MGRVLIVDDEAGIREALQALIEAKGHEVEVENNLAGGQARLQQQHFDLLVTDLRLSPSEDGLVLVEVAKSLHDPPEVVVMTAYGTRERAQAAVEQGASFYIEKGPHLAADLDVLVQHAITKRQLQQENAQLRREIIQRNTLGGIIGRSDAMREVIDMVERVASLKVTVLITGESGTGKEMVARALHHAGSNPQGPFIPLNCGAVPENLMESELFGHVAGAFSGADQAKMGLFEAAKGGTIFLDEIGELPMALQPKLLRVLQERKIKRVGDVHEIDVDVRVVAATNRDLESEAEAGRFREDLYFRLNVVQIDLPPLRQRREDVALLAQHFLTKYAREYGRPVDRIEPEAMRRILEYAFPGNVRQLENLVERGVALSRSQAITVDQLPREVRSAESGPTRVFSVQDDSDFPEEGVDMERLVQDFEQSLIRRALEKSGGVKTKAADLLGLTFRQFRYKLSKIDMR